ncbi:unnamed protein product [Rotaria socialis]|uniref:Uncharacterized protein n=1 Tax=Rotaria socialis TaxID=392032 RepID=A0A817RDL1_9BILA|nr:unnamed protein product [Rotaria socialis]CAF4109595.1 unnamed protein product [Rotaria socialis]CAF4132345.1 unnamed protein product [Rotaria socialis]
MTKVILLIFILFEVIFGVGSINPIKSYVGCFKDSRHQRKLNGLAKPLTSSSMTVTLCINYCANHDFNFAGLQFRSECYCGNSLLTRTKNEDIYDDASICCSWTCSGQLNETCGGDLCNSIYAVNRTTQKNITSATSASLLMLSSGCQSNPCGYGGTCIENILRPIDSGYKCQCIPGRIGNHCEYPDPCRSPDVCSRGNCLSFTENGTFACECRSDTCSSSQAVCDASKITTLTCKCPPNQYGEQCELSCPCQHGGRCIIQNDNTTALCRCDESRFYGDLCEYISPCASQPCYMGGTCTRNETRFVCKCPPNRIGSQCENNDPCQVNPCVGNSTCYRINDYTYKCVCDQVHTGKNCQDIVPTINRYGLFHSACVRANDCDVSLGLICFPERRCACMDGFTWTIDKEKLQATGRCEPINVCLQSPCLNQGQCEQRNGTTEYMCQCRLGYGGKNCQIQSRDRSNQCYTGFCLNGGSCYVNNNGQMECVCSPGYMGRYCDIAIGPCYSNPCPHPESVCLSVHDGYICLCNDNQLLEPYCNMSKYCPGSMCNGRGICYNALDENSYCRCLEPYTGSHCTLIDTCSLDQICHPSATCIPMETGSYCACPPDRTGPTCHEEFWLDPCLSSLTTCLHHGTCTSSPALSVSSSSQSYKCACTEAYTGSRCEIELPCPSQRCLHDGTCQRNVQFGYFECLCTSDYLGSSCERVVPTTTMQSPCSSLPCFNGGLCSETIIGGFFCTCLPNFTGLRCGDITTTTTTTAIAVATTTMIIPTAIIEQIIRANDPCKDNPCLNAGSCILNGVGGFICQCLNGFVGNRCEARVDIAPLQNSSFSLINLAWIIPIGLLFLVVVTMLIGFLCCRDSAENRKGDPVYMFEQTPYPTMGITGNTKYREYSNPGFVASTNMPRE